jgi:hypothetical protein
VKSFHCDVKVDWPAFFTVVTGKAVPADDPAVKKVEAIKISFTNDLSSGSTVEWTLPSGSTESDAGMAQMKSGFIQMMGGFFQTWNRSLNGTLIPLAPRTLSPSANGYTLDDGNGIDIDKLFLDKDLRVTRLLSQTSTATATVETNFQSSPKGLLLIDVTAEYHQPPSAPAVNLIMKTSFAPLGDFLIPDTLAVSIPNALAFIMKFTACTVQKAQ